jgi:hypothetical protein
MEPFQPFLIALLALNLVVFVPLVVRTVRERLGRRHDRAVIGAATPRMLARLAAIADPSIRPEPEPIVEPGTTPVPVVPRSVAPGSMAVVAAPRPAPSPTEVTASRRRVWRDASAALAAFACIGLVVAALGATGLGPFAPVAGRTPAPTPLPTRIAVTLSTDPPSVSPSPSLPLTAVTRPIASFTCSHRRGLTVAFEDTSETWGKPATYLWNFGGDGSSSAADPKHRFSKPGGYAVSLVVSNSAGRSHAFKVHLHPERDSGCR